MPYGVVVLAAIVQDVGVKSVCIGAGRPGPDSLASRGQSRIELSLEQKNMAEHGYRLTVGIFH